MIARLSAIGPCVALLAATLTLTPSAHAAPATATAVSCPTTTVPVDEASADRVWDVAATHLDALAGPRTLPFGATGRSPYLRTSAYAWTSGFYPASLWLMYEHTGDRVWLTLARRYTDRVLTVATWRGTHDLGFMVGLPATLALRLDPSPDRGLRYATALRSASRSLASRWNAKVGAIRSAYYDGRFGVIIDSSMNAPMLIETGYVYGGAEGRRLSDLGLRHMLTLADDFVRPDGSTYHRLAFDPATGTSLGPIPGQGLSTRSTWSRGQSWAVAGFARAYALTGDVRLLDAARRTADFWISRVPGGCIPAWDLDVTDQAAPRDSSAAAIVADGLQTLALVEPDATRAATYRAYAADTLGTLATAPWTTARGRGVLQRQAYSIPADRREGTYAWGDAYLLHAIALSADDPVVP